MLNLQRLFFFAEPKPPPRPPRARSANVQPRRRSAAMAERYADLVTEMKTAYGIRIRKWRTSTTGCAWEVHYRDGSVTRLIESPYPAGPISCAVFLHEVGHHAIGFGRYKPRCLEEYYAWMWALERMRERDFNITPRLEKRVHDAVRYAIEKARRRGMKRLPAELLPYIDISAIVAHDNAAGTVPSGVMTR